MVLQIGETYMCRDGQTIKIVGVKEKFILKRKRKLYYGFTSRRWLRYYAQNGKHLYSEKLHLLNGRAKVFDLIKRVGKLSDSPSWTKAKAALRRLNKLGKG